MGALVHVAYRVIELALIANLVCNESGWDHQDGKYVLTTLVNRARVNSSSLLEEAYKPYQYATMECKHLKKEHFLLASLAISGKLRVPEKPMRTATHFATRSALRRRHRRCKGYSVMEVWKHAGYRIARESRSGHVYFYKARRGYNNGRPCPGPKSSGV